MQEALLDELLARTSRTFALAIPRLPSPLRADVALAYLLLRVADTLEDATRWPRAARVAALGDWSRLLADRAADRARALAAAWTADPPVEHEGYRALLAA